MITEIQKRLSFEETLCQLAEEASELAQAAMKLRRAMTGENPTPVTTEDAYGNLLEEVADVLLCLRVLEVPTGSEAYRDAMDQKSARWLTRLEAKDREE